MSKGVYARYNPIWRLPKQYRHGCTPIHGLQGFLLTSPKQGSNTEYNGPTNILYLRQTPLGVCTNLNTQKTKSQLDKLHETRKLRVNTSVTTPRNGLQKNINDIRNGFSTLKIPDLDLGCVKRGPIFVVFPSFSTLSTLVNSPHT